MQFIPAGQTEHTNHPWSDSITVKIAVITRIEGGVVDYKQSGPTSDFKAKIADMMLVGLQ